MEVNIVQTFFDFLDLQRRPKMKPSRQECGSGWGYRTEWVGLCFKINTNYIVYPKCWKFDALFPFGFSFRWSGRRNGATTIEATSNFPTKFYIFSMENKNLDKKSMSVRSFDWLESSFYPSTIHSSVHLEHINKSRIRQTLYNFGFQIILRKITNNKPMHRSGDTHILCCHSNLTSSSCIMSSTCCKHAE